MARLRVECLEDRTVPAFMESSLLVADHLFSQACTLPPVASNTAVHAEGVYDFGAVTDINFAPGVLIPAYATPAVVTSASTRLHALGADDGGEAGLTYNWTTVTGPAGAHPIFGVNGTNAAKDTTVSFNMAGNYVFRVTVTDSGGLHASSDVAVSVLQKLTTIVVGPLDAMTFAGGSVPLTAIAYDQFGNALAQQPKLKWKVVQGKGQVNKHGVYTAGKHYEGTAMVRARAAKVDGFTAITVFRITSMS